MPDDDRIEDASAPVARQPNGRWLPGSSGNPGGRRRSPSALCDDILEQNAEELTETMVQLAKQGDQVALRLCMDRLVPRRKHRPLNLNWPAILTLADVDAAMSATLAALGAGELEVDQASAIAALLDAKRRALEAVELDHRIRALEASPVDSIEARITELTKEITHVDQ